jgi:hypothetical protein
VSPTPAPDTAGFQLGLIDEEFTEFLKANAETDEAHKHKPKSRVTENLT